MSRSRIGINNEQTPLVKDEHDEEVIEIDIPSLNNSPSFFRKITIVKKRVDERKSFEKKYWLSTFLTMLGVMSIPAGVYCICYLTAGKSRLNQHDFIGIQLNQVFEEFGSLCQFSFVDWLCQQRFDQFKSLLGLTHKEYYEDFGFPQSIWPKADELVEHYSQLYEVYQQLEKPGLKEILSPAIAASGPAIFLGKILYEMILDCIAGKNKIYEDSLLEISKTPFTGISHQDAIKKELKIQNEIHSVNEVILRLEKFERVYLKQFYFCQIENLPNDIKRLICEKLDEVSNSEDDIQFLPMLKLTRN